MPAQVFTFRILPQEGKPSSVQFIMKAESHAVRKARALLRGALVVDVIEGRDGAPLRMVGAWAWSNTGRPMWVLSADVREAHASGR